MIEINNEVVTIGEMMRACWKDTLERELKGLLVGGLKENFKIILKFLVHSFISQAFTETLLCVRHFVEMNQNSFCLQGGDGGPD